MKKRIDHQTCNNRRPKGRVPLIRLLSLFLLMFLVSYPVVAQSSVKVSLKVDNGTITDVMNAIKGQTGYTFAFDADDITRIGRVTIAVNDTSVDEVMTLALKGTGLVASRVDDVVVISKEIPRPQAQSDDRVTVRGVIKDTEGMPIVGATVVVKGTTVGVVSDANGRYQLTFQRSVGKELVFSFLGMEPFTISYTGQEVIDVIMQVDVKALDDVVVTGYFDRSRSSFTGATTTIKREDIKTFGSTNVLNVLSILDPSMFLKENIEMGSDPNTLPEFVIRGEGSFLGGTNAPTFIVDGHEVSLQYIYDMDVDRIESISILKDASATIHYGSRAANGVIVIETRRPKPGELLVNYSANLTLNVPDLTAYDLMNAREKLEFERLANVWTTTNPNEQYNLDKIYESLRQNVERGVNTYWIAKPLRDAFSQQHSIYVSGGDYAVTYGLNGNYNRNNGVMKGSFRETYGISFDLTYRLKDRVNIRNTFAFSAIKAENSPYGTFSNYTSANPYSSIYDDEGDFIPTFEQHGFMNVHYNYLYNASLAHRDITKTQTITDNLSVDWRLTRDLRFKGRVSFGTTTGSSETFFSPQDARFRGTLDVASKGEATLGKSSSWNYNVSTILSYNLNQGVHYFYAGAGFEISESHSQSDQYRVTGFLDERFNDINFATRFALNSTPTASEGTDRMVGILGNLNYAFDNRYFIDLSLRSDGSSKYGSDSRSNIFWSAGAGWNIHNEKFMRNRFPWLEELKWRVSIGETGNNNFDPYMSRTMFAFYTSNVYFQSLGAYLISYGNPTLQWQKSLQKNLGMDLNLIQRRLALNLDYYIKDTKGLLLDVTVAPSLGFDSYYENFGEIRNTGFEFNLSGVVLRNKDFDWALSIKAARNSSEIRRISNALATYNESINSDASNYTKPVVMYEEGESMTAIKVVPSLGINPETGKEVYLNRFGEKTETWDYRDKKVMGDANPDWAGTISTNLSWRQFSLNAALQYGFGGQKYNTTLVNRVEGANPLHNADRRALHERWQQPGDVTFYKNIADRAPSNVSSRFLQDDNYLQLSNVAISYRFDREMLKHWGIDMMRVGVNMADVFHWSTIKRERGLDYPFARQWTCSVNITF